MTIIFDGKNLRDKILNELSVDVEKIDYSKRPRLDVILVGDDPASKIYVNNKRKFADKIGIRSYVHTFNNSVSEDAIIKKIKEFNEDKSVTAILVQLPLPEHINNYKVINAISPQKDVDGLTDYNKMKLYSGGTPFVYPCTPKGVIKILDENNIKIEGKHAVVIGRSDLVGRPLAQMLLNRNATVTVCHSKTESLSNITKTADILISAVGKKLIGENMIKSGCVVIDVGIFKDENDQTTGDVDFGKVKSNADFITPVPGGVGPMTIASLMSNTLELYNKSSRL